MSVLVDNNTRVVVQGITGKEGSFHARQCIAYGTQVVAGVTPGKGGQTMDEVPVFNTVRDAVAKAGANTSLIPSPRLCCRCHSRNLPRRGRVIVYYGRHSDVGYGQSSPTFGRYGYSPDWTELPGA